MGEMSCAHCLRVAQDGTGRIVAMFTVDELEQIAYSTPNPARETALVAIALLDSEKAQRIREDLYGVTPVDPPVDSDDD